VLYLVNLKSATGVRSMDRTSSKRQRQRARGSLGRTFFGHSAYVGSIERRR